MRKRLSARYLLLFLSALVGGLSFPGPNLGWLAWLSLIPLLAYGELAKSRREFIWGVFLSEFVKWMWLVIWLRHVTWIGTIGIALFMAVYQLIWFAIYHRLRNRLKVQGIPGAVIAIIALGLLWAMMEWLRTMPYGMPGNPLNVTQWRYPGILVVCSWIGGYGLSALVVIFNLAFFVGYLRSKTNGLSMGRLANGWWITAILGLIVLVCVGHWVLKKEDRLKAQEAIRVAFIQPYQPPYRYWTRERMVDAVETVFRISGSCVDSDFDLMVWPEGTLPLPIYQGSDMNYEVSNLVANRIRRPLLLGNQTNRDEEAYNAVLSYSAEGVLGEEFYAKNVLVPFGEFVPARRILGFIDRVVPLPDDYTRGRDVGVISIWVKDRDVNISALVCYEDCFPSLSVRAAQNGAEALYVATYDIWYGKELAAYMHAAHSVIRSAETRLPVFRCGSGGWSGFIDRSARVRGVVREDATGSIYFRGYGMLDVVIPEMRGQTFFVRHYTGVLTSMGVGMIGLFLVLLLLRPGREKQSRGQKGLTVATGHELAGVFSAFLHRY